MHKPKKYSALDEDFQRSQREQPVRDHRNILGEFCVFTFSKYLSWAAIVQSRQAKVVIANQAHPADVLLSCWRNIVWRSSLPPSSLCSSTASFSGQGSDRRYGDTRSARGWSCPGLTTASFPSQVSQWQCKGCFYGLMHPLPLSLVIFIKNPAFQFFVLFLIFPARNLKREQKKKKNPGKTRPGIGGSPLWQLAFWGLWTCDLRGKWTRAVTLLHTALWLLNLLRMFQVFWAMVEKPLLPLYILACAAEREIKGEEQREIRSLDMRTENKLPIVFNAQMTA